MNVVGDACGLIIRFLRMGPTPVVATVVGSLYGSLATVLLHLLRQISLATGNGAEESFRVVREARDPGRRAYCSRLTPAS